MLGVLEYGKRGRKGMLESGLDMKSRFRGMVIG